MFSSVYSKLQSNHLYTNVYKFLTVDSLFGLLDRLASLSDGQGLLGSDDDGSTAKGSLGKILAIPLLNNQILQLVQGPASTSLHVYGGLAATRPVGLLGLFDGHCESLVFRSSSDADGLVVDKTRVTLGVLVGDVEGVCGEGLGHSALLEKVDGAVAGDGPGDVGRHFEC